MSQSSRTSTDRDSATGTPRDLLRQIAVLVALGFTLVSVFVNVGGLGGTRTQDTQDGALSADGSYLAPAGPAFSIWSAIYLGLIGYAIWQALPASAPRTVSARSAGGSSSRSC